MAQLKDLIVSGATRILGKTYSPEFVGKLTGNADTATKATSDHSGTNIRSNYALYNGFSFSNNGNGVYLKSTAGAGTVATSATVPAATDSVWGVVTPGTQTFGGQKTFNGLIISATGNNSGIKVGNTYITAINGDLIFQNNTSIRFGTGEWDYDKWAGLKYVPDTKTIYLGIPEKSIFTANSVQSGGTLMLPAIRYLSMNDKTVIDAADSWLRINEGKAFNSGVYFGTNIVRTDGQFQVADSGTKFKADSDGNGYFANNVTIAGDRPLTFYGSGNGTYTQGCVHVRNSDGIIIEVPRATEASDGKILALKVRTRGGQPAAEYAGDRLVETDYTYNLGSATAEFANGFIRSIAARHLDADAVFTNDHTLYIGYGSAAYTNKTAFYYSPSLSSRTQFAEINSNGLYALTRFGVNGQNTGYTFYVNGTSYFSGNIYPAGNIYIGPSGAGGYLNGSAANGGCNSIMVGDDVWLGDVNQGGIMGMKSTSSNTGFWFYNSSGTNTGKLYVDSSGNLFSNNNILPLTANTYALGNGSYYWSSTSTQWLHANRANSCSDGGITLYGADAEYGILFRQTSTLGTHGYVTSDCATYFTMNNSANRGWIFRRWGNKNVASIDTDGNTRLSGCLVVDNRSIFNSLVINSSGISVDGDGKYNYCKIATIKISGGYINRPITFEVSGRGRNSSRISIMFQNTNSTDPALSSFTSNWDNCYFIKKTATSTWEVYNQYSESYGSCRVNRVYGEGYSYGGIVVTWNMENISALPDGTTRVSYAGNVNFANSSANAEYISNENKYMRFHWAGQGGQPSWLWGGNEAGNMYVYNPSNFSVANADTVDGQHASAFATAGHTHTKSQITDFPSSMPASDVYAWAKASSKPSYSWSEITGKPSTFTPSSHTHSYVPLSGSTVSNPNAIGFSLSGSMTGNLLFSNTGDTNGDALGVGGVNGGNDGWTVRGYQTAANKGCLEIAVGDDGDEGIYVRQYTSANYKLLFMNKAGSASGLSYREIVLMEPGTGNSVFPGTITATTFKGNLSGNASTASNADTVDNYHASSLWRSDGATWNPNANVSLNASDNNQEWSFDIRRNSKTGCYWCVWDSSLATMLKVNADDGKVSAPYNFVGKLEGTAKTLARSGDVNTAMTFNWSGQEGQPSWLWGGNDGSNMYVYNPSNFNVNYSNYTSRLGTNSSTAYTDPGGLTWNNLDGSVVGAVADRNDTPTGAWWYILRNRHTNQFNDYYTDVAIPFNDNSIYYKIVRNGGVAGNTWCKVLDAWNYSSYALPLSGGTISGSLTVTSNVKTNDNFLANNDHGLYVADTNGNYRSVIDLNASNLVVVGYGLHAAGIGGTIICGKEIIFQTPQNGWFRTYYKPGDSFTVHLTCGGFCTEYAKNLYFTIPIDRPMVGITNVSVRSSQGLIIRQNNKYLYGSGVGSYIQPASYTAKVSGGTVWVYATFSNTTNATNNSACGCTVDVVVTFS